MLLIRFQVRVSLSSSLAGQLSCKQQPMKGAAVRLARIQDPTIANLANPANLGVSMPGLSALLAGTVNYKFNL